MKLKRSSKDACAQLKSAAVYMLHKIERGVEEKSSLTIQGLMSIGFSLLASYKVMVTGTSNHASSRCACAGGAPIFKTTAVGEEQVHPAPHFEKL